MNTPKYSALKGTNLPNPSLTESHFMRKVESLLRQSKNLIENAPKKEY